MNVNKGDANMQSWLELTKDRDVVFALEPPIHTHQGQFYCRSLPSLRPITRIGARTKLIVLLSEQNTRLAKVFSNPSRNCTAVLLLGVLVCGVYLPGNGSTEDLLDDLDWIANKLRLNGNQGGQVFGDFNAPLGSRRRGIIEEWSRTQGLTPGPHNETTTWSREREGRTVSSSLDLVFSKEGSPFRAGPLHLSFTGSDHCALEGRIPTPLANLLGVIRIDWGWWEEQVEKKALQEASLPLAEGDLAYDVLARLTREHLKEVNLSPRSKQWWDAEVSEQLHATRSATLTPHYKTERCKLKKLIRTKKREH